MESVSPLIFFETACADINDAFWLVTSRRALRLLFLEAVNKGIEVMTPARPATMSIDSPV